MAVLEEKDVMKMLEETEAVLHGHFLLTSGLHSPMYVEKFNVLQHPKYTERLCQEIARRYENDNVELVVGPMTGGSCWLTRLARLWAPVLSSPSVKTAK